MLRLIDPTSVPALRRDAVDADTAAVAARIVGDVQRGGEAALRAHAERLGDLAPGAPLVVERDALQEAFEGLPAADQGVLLRTAERIRAFADAQRAALGPVEIPIPGGVAGLRYAPVERAGCYAPGGRHPLPSSVLMTAITARAAGVREVWVASPRPAPETLAAAYVAGADALLAVGGAQAIAALAYGAGPVPVCDAVVGPGNRWVTAAKQHVAGTVAIDMLAGPSELVVVADSTADPARVAADLLAQAEHDPDAVPILILMATSPEPFLAALEEQLLTLPTAAVAREALGNGFVTVVTEAAVAAGLCDRLAPEHLALHGPSAEELAPSLLHYGSLFVGEGAAEVLGDYGAGPNHTLPTGGTARSCGALSVATFLRVQTWMRLDDSRAALPMVADAVALARMEGLEAHARAAELRLDRSG